MLPHMPSGAQRVERAHAYDGARCCRYHAAMFIIAVFAAAAMIVAYFVSCFYNFRHDIAVFRFDAADFRPMLLMLLRC